MIETHAITRRDWLILLLVLFIAAVMRLSEAGVAEFFHDDAMVANMAQELADGERWPFTGIISSTGIPNTPISIYFMAIPFLFSPDPMVAIGFVMLWNVVGVGVLWAIAHRYFGRQTALIAGLVYAISPWAVLFSRKIWAQDFHTPFLLIGLLLALIGFLEAPRRDQPVTPSRGQRLAQIFAAPVFLIGVQIHFAAVALLPVLAVIVFAGLSRIRFSTILISGLFCVAVLTPYAIGLTQTLSDDPTRISAAAERSDITTGLTFSLDSLTDSLYLITGFGMETWVAPEQQEALLTDVPPSPLWSLSGIAALIGLIALFLRRRTLAVIIVVWAFLPPLLLIPQWTPVYVHYFIGSIPAYALLIAYGVMTIARLVPLQPNGRSVIFIAYIVVLVTQVIWWRGLLRWVDTVNIDYPGYTTPIHYLIDIRDSVQNVDDVIVLSYGMSWSLHHESVVWPVLLHEQAQCVRTLIGDGYAVLPDQPYTVIVAPDAPPNPVGNFYATDEPVVMPDRDGSTGYTLYYHETAPEWETPINAIEPARFDNGVILTGYHRDNDQITLRWQLPAGERGQDYQYSVQLFDASGERVGQSDQPFWHGRHWCAGDTLMTWVNVPVSASPVEVRVSQYQLGAGDTPFIPANLLDDANNPAGQQVIIPLP